MTGRRASKKSSAPVIDPYLPTAGNFGYRVSRYELELEYKVAINRLAGTATVTAVTLAELQMMELVVLEKLHWELAAPTSLQFLSLFLHHFQPRLPGKLAARLARQAETFLTLAATEHR